MLTAALHTAMPFGLSLMQQGHDKGAASCKEACHWQCCLPCTQPINQLLQLCGPLPEPEPCHVAQGLQGEAAAALQRVLPPAMLLDLRMGSQAALLAMADAFPGHASVRRTELDRFRQSVHEVSSTHCLALASAPSNSSQAALLAMAIRSGGMLACGAPSSVASGSLCTR